MGKLKTLLPLSLLLFGSAGNESQAVTLYEEGGDRIDINVDAAFGLFHSKERYVAKAGRIWQEGYFKATLAGEVALTPELRLRGGIGGLTLGTWGNGDAGGHTDGSERRSKIEDAYAGLTTVNGLVDFSFGRQKFQLGDGFLIGGDFFSVGNGPLVAGAKVNRGGAYYLAAQKNFDGTAILRLNPKGTWRGDLFWLKSDVALQQYTKLAGLNFEHVDEHGTLAVSYLHVLDVDKDSGLGLWNQREGMKVYSLRGQGSLGMNNLFISFEYVAERDGDTKVKNRAQAWYLEGGWTFADAPFTPTINYRHAYFSADNPDSRCNEAFDPLFVGVSRGLGTWYQGQVASNYAGPANSGNRVDRLELTIAPRRDIAVTLQAWSFRRVDHAPKTDAREVDLFAWWKINEHFTFIPLVGLYKPRGNDVVAAQGNKNWNVYLQGVLLSSF